MWRGTSRRADDWQSVVEVYPYLVRAVRYGIQEMPPVSFPRDQEFGRYTQTEEEKTFDKIDVASGIDHGIYEGSCLVVAEEGRRVG